MSASPLIFPAKSAILRRMTVDILCRVVDNFGDIGFAYRLSRALSELPAPPAIRLIVDDLGAFAGLCPEVDPSAGLQPVAGWIVVRWNEPGDEALRLFRAERPRVVVECYACGRPDWFESILFDADDPALRTVINLEYLSAESWASEYHLLPSLTRSPLVKKFFFMPGFAAGTGGLLQDSSFVAAVDSRAASGAARAKCAALAALKAIGVVENRPAGSSATSFGERSPAGASPSSCDPSSIAALSDQTSVPGDVLFVRDGLLPGATNQRSPSDPSVASPIVGFAETHPSPDVSPPGYLSSRTGEITDSGASDMSFSPESAFWFLLFTYEHDFTSVVADLSRFAAARPLLVVLAAGRSASPFLDAWSAAGRPFPVLPLPFVSQPVWDTFLVAADFPVVRGEETLSRAALMGRPFLWQCYPFPPDAQGASTSIAETPCFEAPETADTGKSTPESALSSGEPAASGGQNPKVFAVLDQLRPYLNPDDFASWERLLLAFNGITASEPVPGDLLAVLRRVASAQPSGSAESSLLPLSSLASGFSEWSADVRKLGNLAANLMTFIAKIG
jgi:hypothetical protein